ncbi:macro domain-containing protein RSc0334-like isoform X1 [Macrosteles quadrilineatus]|uniref:macro domain-containing protein RSc0334-like isoform X1 n=2 Tax=Macrosteles quadrilineatus TaxID=74068 RepID=UPI0023E2640D|nr:macro domain-containing protein RSc0334-like isoform X1 [Macrosteles quadrilineatus]
MCKVLNLRNITTLSVLSLSSTSSLFKMADTVLENRNMWIQMPLNEKRTHYKCGDNFVTLDKVPTWTLQSKKLGSSLVQRCGGKDYNDSGFGPFSANPSLADKVSMWEGDITKLEIDAIVNAANESLLGGGGVDGAIHRAAGPELKAECKTLHGCPTGQAKITGGYRLPARYVIHTVGPRGEKPDLLEQCYQNSLDIVRKEGLRSVAFPCISTGIYGYPQENAAKIALTTVRNFLDKNADSIDRVIFCLFLEEDIEIYKGCMPIAFPLAKV